jgi:tetratricopeptide (TPR) repeat protein
MSFWSRWFGKARSGEAVPEEPEASFDQALGATVPRYTHMERDGTALDPVLSDSGSGVVRPASERFPDRHREWAAIRSPWDRRGVLFSVLDDLLGSTLAPWQFAERLTEDRRPHEALHTLDAASRTTSVLDARVCAASARALICLERFDEALEEAQQGLAIAPQGRRLRLLAADARHLLGGFDDAHAVYRAMMSEARSLRASPRAIFEQLFAFEHGALRSPVVALGAATRMPALWPLIEDEFYWSPYVRANHAYQLARGDESMRGFAKLVALIREMPWLAEATLNCMQLFESLDPGGKAGLCAADREDMRRAIQDNGWSMAKLHPLEPIEFDIAAELRRLAAAR